MHSSTAVSPERRTADGEPVQMDPAAGREPADPATAGRVDGDANADLSVTLYLRSAASTPARRRQTAVRERVAALEAGDAFGRLDHQRVSKHAEVPGRGEPDPGATLFDELEATVGDDVELHPFFTHRDGTGSVDRIVVPPVACLVARRDGVVVGLYPCWVDGEHRSVEDGVARAERGESLANLERGAERHP